MSRLDVYLSENGLVKSRERAKKLIKDGCITVNKKICTKPSAEVSDSDVIEVSENSADYVGRGFLKLETAFSAFDIDVRGKVCADIGASTGGFTECMLKRGADYVYAIDVGHGQLDKELADNPKVKNCEGVNARYLTADFFDRQPEFMGVDLSFISLRLVVPALISCLKENGKIACLIKPQFEAGKKALNKNGIVKNPKDHARVLKELVSFFLNCGADVQGLAASSVKGGDGNIEYLALLVKTNERCGFSDSFDIDKFTAATFKSFSKD